MRCNEQSIASIVENHMFLNFIFLEVDRDGLVMLEIYLEMIENLNPSWIERKFHHKHKMPQEMSFVQNDKHLEVFFVPCLHL